MVNLRLLLLAIPALFFEFSTAPSLFAETGSVGGAGVLAAEQQKAQQQATRYHFGRRRNIVEFLMPPVQASETAHEAPPLVTLYSDPKLRAKYPPNPGAPTVAQSLHQPIGSLVEFRYSLQGQDESLLERQSRTDALMSLAGEVYYKDRILLSQDLMPKYFQQNGDRFIRASYISNRHIVGGKPNFDLTLLVDRDALMRDLEEKRFVFRPALRPLFFVFLDQTVNGVKDDQQRGRAAMEAVINDRNQRYAEENLPSMANINQDITASKDLFLEARRAAQRNEVEVAFSGKMIARPADLEATISDEDWKNNTLEVAVDTGVLSAPVAAHLPVSLLVKELDRRLAESKKTGGRVWWDIGSIEVNVPLNTMVLTEADRKTLEDSGAQLRTVVPVTRIGMKRNYYKPYFYTAVRMNLTLVRIDNGEVIGDNMAEAAAGAEDRNASIQQAIQEVSSSAANKLIDKFMDLWPLEMGNKANYKIMITAVTPQQLEGLMSMIESSVSGSKVYLRSLLGNTAVVTVAYPKDLNALAQTIEGMEFPRLRLVSRSDKGLEYQRVDSKEIGSRS